MKQTGSGSHRSKLIKEPGSSYGEETDKAKLVGRGFEGT
jgi:hypothetical protein